MGSDISDRPCGPSLLRLVSGILVLACFAPHAGSAEPPPRLLVPAVADLAGAEAAWSRAARIELSDFWKQKSHLSEPTEVLLFNTGRALRVRFLAEDSDIRADPARPRDGDTYHDDCVEIFFARPEASVAEGIGLEISAAGVVSDMRVWRRDKLDHGWDSRAALVDGHPDATVPFTIHRVPSLRPFGGKDAVGAGWMLEIEFPWSYLCRELGLPDPGDGPPARLRANFARWDYGAAGRMFTIWSDSGLPLPSPHVPGRYGWLMLSKE